jgi:hypothetical protein
MTDYTEAELAELRASEPDLTRRVYSASLVSMTSSEEPASRAEIEAQALGEAGGGRSWQQRTRREHIEVNLDDMITDLFYYDRKEDETLPVGAIEEAVKAGEITEAEIVERVSARLREALRGQV